MQLLTNNISDIMHISVIHLHNKFHCGRMDRVLFTFISSLLLKESTALCCVDQSNLGNRGDKLIKWHPSAILLLLWFWLVPLLLVHSVMTEFTENMYSPHGYLYQYQTKRCLNNCQIQGHYFIWQLSSIFTQTISQYGRHCSPHHFCNLPCIRAHAF